MKKLLRRLLKFAAYVAASVVILLAIALGLFRLFLPRLPEYQEDIKSWASAAIGMQVEFTGMNARWGLSGPEVEFYDAELISTDNGVLILAAEEVSVGIGLARLLFDRKFIVDQIVVRDTSVELRQLENGQWWIQGGPLEQLLPARPDTGEDGGSGDVGRIEVVGEDITLQYLQPGDEHPREFIISRLRISRDNVRLSVDANIELPDDLGDSLTVFATQIVTNDDGKPGWDVAVEADDIELAGISDLPTTQAAKFSSGRGDLDLSFAIADGSVTSATADFDFEEIGVEGMAGFSFNGRLEFLNDSDGWLVVANSFRLETENGTWPLSTLRVETGTGSDGEIIMLDVHASYLKLDDAGVLRPWLNPEQQIMLASYNPDGLIRNLEATFSDVDTDAPRFDISVDFERIGIAAVGKIPGVRGFTGALRADRSGGRFEIDSGGLAVNLPIFLPEPVLLDEVSGTVIWRRSSNRTTVLSDSIVLRNEDFSIETNVELSLADHSRLPIVDLASTFSINDISVAMLC